MVHIDCRKVYISKNSIAASKRRAEDDETPTAESPPHKKREESNGQSCLNASSTSDDFNEGSEYAPDILESFYSDTLVNGNDDNESDIEQLEEEEEDDEQEEN
ncbi:hypothetical protein J6590_052417 [Homalodisca vitripennis]|nr:hypothetical protein J6590_052417 [Homalodisca vitripennis]